MRQGRHLTSDNKKVFQKKVNINFQENLPHYFVVLQESMFVHQDDISRQMFIFCTHISYLRSTHILQSTAGYIHTITSDTHVHVFLYEITYMHLGLNSALFKLNYAFWTFLSCLSHSVIYS